jgi:3',5'-cyclic AMP phosphodiesterase CpdA
VFELIKRKTDLSGRVFSFAFIADPQIGMDRASGGEPGSDKERLDRAIAYVNEREIDFVVFGGDQVENPLDEHTAPQLDALQESLSALTAPYYGVVGNHEQGAPQQEWKYIQRGLPVRFSLSHKNTFLVGVNACRSDLIDLFRSYEVSCVLTGHWHQDIDARWRGISLITSVGTAGSLQYPEELSFKVVTVFEDGWSVRRVAVDTS